MVVAKLVDPRGEVVGRKLVQCVARGVAGRPHVNLLAAGLSGEAPLSPAVAGAETYPPARSLIGAHSGLRRPWRALLLTVHRSRAATRSCRSDPGFRQRPASTAGTSWHPECIDVRSENAGKRVLLENADERMVDQ